LDLDATVLDNIMDVQDMTSEAARTHLGKFLFTGDDVFRPVRQLSGGEKNKLVLSQITLLNPNVLVLDEPTNHLDIESRESLIKMLRSYDGTLLLVSHDRYLLDQVATRIVEVARGAASAFDGTFSEFRERHSRVLPNSSQKAKRPKGAAIVVAAAPLNAHQRSKERRRAQAALEIAEAKVSELETLLAEIEGKLSDPSPDDDLVSLASQHTEVGDQLNEAVTAWEQAATYCEELE
jgi:ATP-binding cassette subfamily F protein 3